MGPNTESIKSKSLCCYSTPTCANPPPRRTPADGLILQFAYLARAIKNACWLAVMALSYPAAQPSFSHLWILRAHGDRWYSKRLFRSQLFNSARVAASWKKLAHFSLYLRSPSAAVGNRAMHFPFLTRVYFASQTLSWGVKSFSGARVEAEHLRPNAGCHGNKRGCRLFSKQSHFIYVLTHLFNSLRNFRLGVSRKCRSTASWYITGRKFSKFSVLKNLKVGELM